jgi:phosphatidylglycerol:prolipoprotein diacylglycerol transferase
LYPRLLQLGNFNLYTYGILAAVGLIVGLTLIVHLAKRDGIDEENTWNLGLICIVAGVIGAKLLLVINDWPYYSKHFREIFSFNVFQAGGVYSGALVLGTATGIAFMRWKHMPVLRTLDAFAPGIALGQGIGRLGCFAAGCCYGKPTGEPWAVTFTNPLAAKVVGTPLGIPLHPTQLYEFLADIAIFALLIWMGRHRRFAGQVAGTFAFLYGIARFFIEFYRDDPERGSVFGGFMSLTQLLALLLVILGGVLWMQRGGEGASKLEAA